MRGLVAVLALLVPFAGGSEAARAPVPRGEIFVVGVDGRGRQNLTRTAATESELALSPDGRRIAYVHSERQQFQVWVMNDDGSGQRRLTSGGDWEFGPQWSPDGRRLAYMVWDFAACTPVSGSGCAVPDVWTVDADGSGQRKVLDSAFQPRWSPDGSKLLFHRYEANPDLATLGVYLASSDGTGVRQLVRATLWGSPRAPPAWSPTGRTILYGAGMGAARLHLLSLDGRRSRFLAVLVAGVVARRQPDRLHAHKRHLGHPLARRLATPNRSRLGAAHPSVSGLVAHRKAGRVQLRQPVVRRPRGQALDETRHGGRHRYVRRLLPSLTAGLVSQRPAPVLLELRSPSGAFLSEHGFAEPLPARGAVAAITH